MPDAAVASPAASASIPSSTDAPGSRFGGNGAFSTCDNAVIESARPSAIETGPSASEKAAKKPAAKPRSAPKAKTAAKRGASPRTAGRKSPGGPSAKVGGSGKGGGSAPASSRPSSADKGKKTGAGARGAIPTSKGARGAAGTKPKAEAAASPRAASGPSAAANVKAKSVSVPSGGKRPSLTSASASAATGAKTTSPKAPGTTKARTQPPRCGSNSPRGQSPFRQGAASAEGAAALLQRNSSAENLKGLASLRRHSAPANPSTPRAKFKPAPRGKASAGKDDKAAASQDSKQSKADADEASCMAQCMAEFLAASDSESSSDSFAEPEAGQQQREASSCQRLAAQAADDCDEECVAEDPFGLELTLQPEDFATQMLNKKKARDPGRPPPLPIALDRTVLLPTSRPSSRSSSPSQPGGDADGSRRQYSACKARSSSSASSGGSERSPSSSGALQLTDGFSTLDSLAFSTMTLDGTMLLGSPSRTKGSTASLSLREGSAGARSLALLLQESRSGGGGIMAGKSQQEADDDDDAPRLDEDAADEEDEEVDAAEPEEAPETLELDLLDEEEDEEEDGEESDDLCEDTEDDDGEEDMEKVQGMWEHEDQKLRQGCSSPWFDDVEGKPATRFGWQVEAALEPGPAPLREAFGMSLGAVCSMVDTGRQRGGSLASNVEKSSTHDLSRRTSPASSEASASMPSSGFLGRAASEEQALNRHRAPASSAKTLEAAELMFNKLQQQRRISRDSTQQRLQKQGATATVSNAGKKPVGGSGGAERSSSESPEFTDLGDPMSSSSSAAAKGAASSYPLAQVAAKSRRTAAATSSSAASFGGESSTTLQPGLFSMVAQPPLQRGSGAASSATKGTTPSMAASTKARSGVVGSGAKALAKCLAASCIQGQ
eukprot:TRINITY_DN5947_c0_g3_i1.p1 TRINITY_DN5947_c0_g3~~TRINITY_DN5947_c0_g3_i1.p1  ORF type:complete len:953 (-),score=251.23 TRINITY_DN5947_c0_g3_i1:257-2935(-)